MYRKHISIPDKHQHVYDYLQSLNNASAYIINLVIKDMEKQDTSISKNEVIQIIDEYLGKKNNLGIDPQVVDTVKGLLDL